MKLAATIAGLIKAGMEAEMRRIGRAVGRAPRRACWVALKMGGLDGDGVRNRVALYDGPGP